MPRINNLDPARHKVNLLCDFIRRRAKDLELSQSEMAAELFISQQAYSYRLRTGSFTTDQLIRIFRKLKASKEEAGELLIL